VKGYYYFLTNTEHPKLGRAMRRITILRKGKCNGLSCFWI
jgi:hypothetical protein